FRETGAGRVLEPDLDRLPQAGGMIRDQSSSQTGARDRLAGTAGPESRIGRESSGGGPPVLGAVGAVRYGGDALLIRSGVEAGAPGRSPGRGMSALRRPLVRDLAGVIERQALAFAQDRPGVRRALKRLQMPRP